MNIAICVGESDAPGREGVEDPDDCDSNVSGKGDGAVRVLGFFAVKRGGFKSNEAAEREHQCYTQARGEYLRGQEAVPAQLSNISLSDDRDVENHQNQDLKNHQHAEYSG
ncbi:hypothetical protein D3C75_774590 [compost metagenome]